MWRGSISSEIAALSSLEHFFLNGNDMTGTLPNELGTFPNMTYFNVALNRFRGKPFPLVANWSKLERLDLGNNRFSGSIPSELGSIAPQMEQFLVPQNRFTGTVPTELGAWTEMRKFFVSRNFDFEPFNIPTEFGRWSNLGTKQWERNCFRVVL